jgi:hypothetical protein
MPFHNTKIIKILSLIYRSHQFEFHKPQDYWRFTWSLTSGPVELVEVRAS